MTMADAASPTAPASPPGARPLPRTPGAAAWAVAGGLVVASVAVAWYVRTVSDLAVRYTPSYFFGGWRWALPVAIGIVVFAWLTMARRAEEGPATDRNARARLLRRAFDAVVCAAATLGGGMLLVEWAPAEYTQAAGEAHREPATIWARGEGRPGAEPACRAYAVQVRPAGHDDLVRWCGGRDAWARAVPGAVVLSSWRSSSLGTVGTDVQVTPGS